MNKLSKNLALTLSLGSLFLCHIIVHGFALHQTDVSCLTNPDGTHPDVDALRGGAAYSEVVEDVRPKTKSVIVEFLASCAGKNNTREFHIQGWRWHFMSLIRDSNRLERLAKFLLYDVEGPDDSGLNALEKAADYVVNFNMAGLHRVESKMFVQWLRDNLCDPNKIGEFGEHDGKSVSDAFRDVIDKVNEHRVESSQIGKELVSDWRLLCQLIMKCFTYHQLYSSYVCVLFGVV